MAIIIKGSEDTHERIMGGSWPIPTQQTSWCIVHWLCIYFHNWGRYRARKRNSWGKGISVEVSHRNFSVSAPLLLNHTPFSYFYILIPSTDRMGPAAIRKMHISRWTHETEIFMKIKFVWSMMQIPRCFNLLHIKHGIRDCSRLELPFNSYHDTFRTQGRVWFND
jgi:hypothetical protein